MMTKQRLLSALLAFCCVFGSVPAMAADTEEVQDSAEYVTAEITEQAEETADTQSIDPEDEDPLAYGHTGAEEEDTESSVDSNGYSRKLVDGTIGKTTTYSFLTNKTYLVPAGYNLYDGIDVSRYNQSINWTAVKNAGVDFAIIRIGYTGYMSGTQCEDSYYKTNLKGAINAGIPVGVYIFSQALNETEARAEAQFVIDRIKGYNITLPVVMDYEFAPDDESRLVTANLSKEQATSNCLAFIETVKQAGYEAMVYANKNYLENYLNASTVAAAAPIWLANYTTNTTYAGEYDYWQYSSTGYLSACTGNDGAVDCNFLFTKSTLVGASATTTVSTVAGFYDVYENDWYAEAVQYAKQNGLMNGTSSTTFEPDGTMTRSMAAQILYNLAGTPTVNYSSSFSDVSSDMWYANAVAWAQKNNIVSGVGDNKFAPDDNVTREQLATLLYRYAEYAGKDVTASGDLSKFPDVASVSDFATTAMKWAVGNGIINGAVENGQTVLKPTGSATRAQCAQILKNYYTGVGGNSASTVSTTGETGTSLEVIDPADTTDETDATDQTDTDATDKDDEDKSDTTDKDDEDKSDATDEDDKDKSDATDEDDEDKSDTADKDDTDDTDEDDSDDDKNDTTGKSSGRRKI